MSLGSGTRDVSHQLIWINIVPNQVVDHCLEKSYCTYYRIQSFNTGYLQETLAFWVNRVGLESNRAMTKAIV